MIPIDPKTATILALGFISIAAWCFAGNRISRHRRLLAVLHMELAAARRCMTDTPRTETARDFTETLDTAQIRLRQESPATTGQAPEKYRYLLSLAERGMNPSEISTTLNISVAEVEQLLALSAVSGGRTARGNAMQQSDIF